ncbi:MAG: RDD family protein [Leptospirales bacterium]
MRSVRLLAFFLDLSIAHFFYRLWSFLVLHHENAPYHSSGSASFSGFSIYEPFFVFLYFWFNIGLSSSTPAMALLGIRVLKDDDKKSPPGMAWAFSRICFLFLSILPFGFGAWISLFSPSGKTLYDCLSQTRVFWDTDSIATVSGIRGGVSDHPLD